MGFSLGFSDSDSGSNSSFEQFLSPDQLPFLQDMWSQMGNLWNMGMPMMSPSMTGGFDTMNNTMSSMDPYWQDAMGGGVYGGMDLQGDYSTAFQNILNPSSYTQDIYAGIMGGEGNDYVDALGGSISQMYSDTADRNLAKLDQRAGLMSGSSGWEGAMGDILSESGKNEAATLAGLGYDTFDKDLMNKLDIAKMADTNWLTGATHALDTASGNLANEQATTMGGLDFGGDLWNAGMTQMLLPWTMMSMFSNMQQPLTLGGGTSSSSSDATGIGFTL